MGLGGPIGGFISDRQENFSNQMSYHDLMYRYGWRWAFLIQLPIFVLSMSLTAFSLHYVTPVWISFEYDVVVEASLTFTAGEKQEHPRCLEKN